MKLNLRVALLPLLLAGCKPKDLQYLSFSKPDVVKMGYPESRLRMTVTCFNPNPFQLRLENLDSDIYLDEKFIGKASLAATTPVPRKDTFQIPLFLDVKTGSVLGSALKIASTLPDSAAVWISLEGNARINKSGISMNYPIKYRERKSLLR